MQYRRDVASMQAYEELGVDYQDLCDPYWLEEDDQVFYGFWGSCFNAYRDTKQHRGYDILRKWKQHLAAKRGSDHKSAFQTTFDRLRLRGDLPETVSVDSVTNDPFFVYTSNVDAHFLRDFESDEVYELHGNVERWQCAGALGHTAALRQPCDELWDARAESRFAVDATTMRAEGNEAFTTCAQCGGKARPNVLMFHDKTWIPNVDHEMVQENPSLKLVVLEIGCGTRVPSVRKECEMVVSDLFERCGRAQASLVRINPDFPHCDDDVLTTNDLVLSVQSKGLEALEAIDELLSQMKAAK
ncbi:hypothetical protein FI667_g6325, partial [Globisporangium splendens]